MEGPRKGVTAKRQRKGLPTGGLLKSPHACTACPPNFYFRLTSAAPMLGRKGTGVQAWVLLPHGAHGGWARKGTTGCSGTQRRSWGTAKSKSIPGPSRESSGTETNALIRLFKWIIVSSSFPHQRPQAAPDGPVCPERGQHRHSTCWALTRASRLSVTPQHQRDQ